ncbi:hypothetical protein TU94_31200 [Streptomyces cyaneogriseus subsp. noncyanogenus]|uniref:Uncharacterized protein n=1 Tax=Streptomyces cyaneogriseus subsp. noncyanogenus TaxID=477245 RepID=A0A0C5G5G8_9ACTN|nr:hypothetical protein TU94_31200 [Streptomyces cyaneogriseus subsp. noncyanogenus]
MATSPYRIGRLAFRRRRLAGGVWPGVPDPAVTGVIAPAGEGKDLPMPGTGSRTAFGLLGERR